MSRFACSAVVVMVLAIGLPVGATSLRAQGTPSIPVAIEFDSLHFRSIGPATMSGRIADLAVYERNPAIYYVGTAHGGVWKTTSNGAMFTPLFQDEGLISIGDVTVSQSDPDLVWVGAGESNNRQSGSWGGGGWKSTDGGETFTLMGLRQSRHINRIVIDPNDNNVVLVAATGPLSIDMYLPSLPSIQSDLAASAADTQLSLSAFLIGYACGQLLYGPISDRFGRKPVLLTGMFAYAATSFLCTLSTNIETLIVLRFLQALGNNHRTGTGHHQ